MLKPNPLTLLAMALSVPGVVYAKTSIQLPAPTENQAVVSVERSQAAILLNGEAIYQTPDRVSYFVQTPFRAEATTRAEIYGDMLDSKRIEVGAEGEKLRPWRGMGTYQNVLLLLDGFALEMIAYSFKSNAFLSRHSIMWDQLKPPRDRGGEAGNPEIQLFRSKFVSAMSKSDEIKFVGMSAVPQKWKETDAAEFFVASRLKDFAVLTMACTDDDPARCRIRRGCMLEGASSLVAEDIAGIGVSEARKLVMIGDRKKHLLHVFRYESCLHMPKIGEIALPKEVFQMSNLHIDAADRLWVTTIRPDNYHNATAFWWQLPEIK
jgi:hypothetical protein